jgi:hypothetical protein
LKGKHVLFLFLFPVVSFFSFAQMSSHAQSVEESASFVPKEEEEEEASSTSQRGTVFSSILALINSTIGVGILSLR